VEKEISPPLIFRTLYLFSNLTMLMGFPSAWKNNPDPIHPCDHRDHRWFLLYHYPKHLIS
jgi:hypothetical protein